MRKTSRVGPLFEVPMSKNCTPLWREAHLQVKMPKHLRSRAIFALPMPKNGRLLWREAYLQVKMHKTPQRHTHFCCSNVQKRHAADLICKSKCTKHLRSRATLVLPISKNGTPLWREAHLQVKMHKTPHARATF